ncbi:unnamed protein product [Closterium sp. Yama58-4]|nr:unnamed protein product [Closterium sp. Yama58-4]
MALPAPAPYLSHPGRRPRLSRSFRHGRSPRNFRRPLFPSANAFLLLPLVALLLSPAPFSPAPSSPAPSSSCAPFFRAPSHFAPLLFPGGVASARATPMSVLDVFRPSCPLPPMSGPSGGWSKWSDVTVWGAAFRGSKDPPGVGSRAGVNVTVPCGMAVLLDVANVTLDTLHVHGWLKLLDDKPRLPRIEVRANIIIVTGRLTVGEKDKQFGAQALFTLTPNSGRQRREYGFTLFPPAEPAFPRPLGHKVFAVVGGQVDLHGLPGPSVVHASVGAQLRAFPSHSPPFAFTSLLLLSPPRSEGKWTCTASQARPSSMPVFVHIIRTTPVLFPYLVFYSFYPVFPPTFPLSPFSPPPPKVGGQVDLHGLPGPPSMPVWVRLNNTALAGQTEIVVDADVSTWPVGGEIAIASTSVKMDEAEKAVIAGGVYVWVECGSVWPCRTGFMPLLPPTFPLHPPVTPHPQGYRISLTAPLKYSHDGNPKAVPDSFHAPLPNHPSLFSPLHPPVTPHPQGYRISLTAPLKYSHDGNPKAVPDGFGGAVEVRGEVGLLHRNVVIYGMHEPGKYELEEGVQFAYMGQQGVLGRYPLHFHVCGEANQSHVVRKNAIVYSKQRCVVIHATSNMTIEDTVTYESKGHCFLVEEGSENNVVFKRNLGISVRKVKVVIPSKESYDKHTDDKPSTFWMANPNNEYIDNVAAGSEDTGYWTELKEGMRGLSQLLPNARNMHPIETKFGTYSGNVAHSAKFGFRSYPHGMFPYAPGARTKFGVYSGNVGHLAKFGFHSCPHGIFPYTLGARISPRDLLEPNKITKSWFSSFGTCRAASPAIMLTTNPYGGFWTPSTAVEGLRFANDTNRLWASPNPTSGYIRSGAQLANFYALWDLDGSLLGNSTTTTTTTTITSSSSSSISSSSRPASTPAGFGFAIAPFDPILPPLSLRSSPSFACSYQPSWSAHTCTGPAACFRSFALFYNESVTKDQTANLGKDKRRPYSYVTFTRLQDNATFVSVGSDNDYDNDFPKRYGASRPLLRQVTATLLAGFSYRVTIQRSEIGPAFFYPSSVQLLMLDVGGCTGGLTVIMDTPPNSPDKQWTVVSNNPEAPCPGSPVDPSIAYRRSACINGKPMLAFDIGSTAIRSIAMIELTKSTSGSATCTTARCFMSPRRFEGLY